jgi:hypothetical protein
MEPYEESRGGAPDGPVHKHLAATDERASLRGEYEKFFIPQTPSDVISTYPLTPQQGVSGRDANAGQHYVPATQRCSPSE